MSESFPPIHAVQGVEYRAVPKVTTQAKELTRVFDDKVETIKTEYVTYDRGANINTIATTSKAIDILI